MLVDGEKLQKHLQGWLDEGDCDDETYNTICQIKDELLVDKDFEVPIQTPSRIEAAIRILRNRSISFIYSDHDLANILAYAYGLPQRKDEKFGVSIWTDKDFGLEEEK